MSAAATLATPSTPRPSASSASSVVNPRPTPLRDQAFALHCGGLRSPAIAQQLGVPERTIRAWIATDLKSLAEEQRATRHQQLALAVARQQDLTAAAWKQFETESSARAALLDAILSALSVLTSSTSPTDGPAPAPASALPRLPASTPAPRYLSLILRANKEINRLLGLYHIAKLDALTSDLPPSPTSSEFAAESATSSIEIPAESAIASAPTASAFRPSIHRAPAFQGRDPSVPAKSATYNTGLTAGLQPAKPAIPPNSPYSAFGRRPPAESATTTDSPLPLHVEALPAAPAGSEDSIPAEAATSSHLPLSAPSPSSASAVNPPSVPLRALRALRDLRGKSPSFSGRIGNDRKPNRRPSAGRKSRRER